MTRRRPFRPTLIQAWEPYPHATFRTVALAARLCTTGGPINLALHDRNAEGVSKGKAGVKWVPGF